MSTKDTYRGDHGVPVIFRNEVLDCAWSSRVKVVASNEMSGEIVFYAVRRYSMIHGRSIRDGKLFNVSIDGRHDCSEALSSMES